MHSGWSELFLQGNLRMYKAKTEENRRKQGPSGALGWDHTLRNGRRNWTWAQGRTPEKQRPTVIFSTSLTFMVYFTWPNLLLQIPTNPLVFPRNLLGRVIYLFLCFGWEGIASSRLQLKTLPLGNKRCFLFCPCLLFPLQYLANGNFSATFMPFKIVLRLNLKNVLHPTVHVGYMAIYSMLKGPAKLCCYCPQVSFLLFF